MVYQASNYPTRQDYILEIPDEIPKDYLSAVPGDIIHYVDDQIEVEDSCKIRRTCKQLQKIPYLHKTSLLISLNQRICLLDCKPRFLICFPKQIDDFLAIRDSDRFAFPATPFFKVLDPKSHPMEFRNAKAEDCQDFTPPHKFDNGKTELDFKDGHFEHVFKGLRNRSYRYSEEVRGSQIDLIENNNVTKTLHFNHRIQAAAMIGSLLALLMNGKIHVVNQNTGRILNILHLDGSVVSMGSSFNQNELIYQKADGNIYYIDFAAPPPKRILSPNLSFKLTKIVNIAKKLIVNIFKEAHEVFKDSIKENKTTLSVCGGLIAAGAIFFGVSFAIGSAGTLGLLPLITGVALIAIAIFAFASLIVIGGAYVGSLLLVGLPTGIIETTSAFAPRRRRSYIEGPLVEPSIA